MNKLQQLVWKKEVEGDKTIGYKLVQIPWTDRWEWQAQWVRYK
jgi:hypothetical protein